MKYISPLMMYYDDVKYRRPTEPNCGWSDSSIVNQQTTLNGFDPLWVGNGRWVAFICYPATAEAVNAIDKQNQNVVVWSPRWRQGSSGIDTNRVIRKCAVQPTTQEVVCTWDCGRTGWKRKWITCAYTLRDVYWPSANVNFYYRQ